MTPEPALMVARMVAKITEGDRSNSPVKQAQNEVGRATKKNAIHDCARHEGLAPHESADGCFRYIAKIIDHDWGFYEETPYSHIQVEEHWPEKCEERSADETGHSITTERASNES